jgi:hypothetical protein
MHNRHMNTKDFTKEQKVNVVGWAFEQDMLAHVTSRLLVALAGIVAICLVTALAGETMLDEVIGKQMHDALLLSIQLGAALVWGYSLRDQVRAWFAHRAAAKAHLQTLAPEIRTELTSMKARDRLVLAMNLANEELGGAGKSAPGT